MVNNYIFCLVILEVFVIYYIIWYFMNVLLSICKKLFFYFILLGFILEDIFID